MKEQPNTTFLSLVFSIALATSLTPQTSFASDSDGQPNIRGLNESDPSDRPTPAAWEFYGLKKDPAEMNNLYGDPAYKDPIDKMKSQLQKTREALDETDRAYPEIQRVIRAHWND